uniref:MAM domain-containing protein n=1 Tax=Anolis carolinensis TaxID=28377 RepID=A0A803T519_ANOCA
KSVSTQEQGKPRWLSPQHLFRLETKPILLQPPVPSILCNFPCADSMFSFPEGFFIYLKSNKANPGDMAHLLSPTCASKGPRCFHFWYHMYGVARTMALHVYVVLDGGSPELVWSETGNQGDRWKKAEVSIAHTGRLQIILEGVRGEDFRSDVAVDDIYMTRGYCPGEASHSEIHLCVFLYHQFCEFKGFLFTRLVATKSPSVKDTQCQG